MPDSSAVDFPCPRCLLDILLDEDTQGREITCPHCEERVLLPKLAVLGKPNITLKPIVPKRKKPPEPVEEPQLVLPLEILPSPQTEPLPAPKNFPLHKSVALEEPGDLELRPEQETSLPSKDKSREEEIRRLAAMAGNVDYDLAKFQRKGMITFGCPLCRRPMWVAKKDAGMTLSCEGCNTEVISPRPELGLPAEVADTSDDEPASLLPKAVLPTARRVEDVTLKEGQAGGRARRMAPLPKESLTAPASESPPPRQDKMQPVPARADQSLDGIPVSLPSERISTARTVGGKRSEAPAETPQPSQAVSQGAVAPREPKVAKGAVRLNNQRRNFSPQKEMETDLEITESWGQVEDKPPVSRRYVIIGWLVMIPIFLGLLIWGMKEVFRKKSDLPAATKLAHNDKNEAEIVRVAQGVLTKFYEAKTIDEMARYVRHPEITKARMEDWYHRPYPRFRVESFSDAQVSNVEGVEFIIGLLHLSGESPRSVALEVPDEGTVGILADDLRIDWESMVYWSEQTWDNFLAQQGDRSCEFRVVLKREPYPNAPYDDENRWVCFKLNYPGTVQEQYGYCFGYVELNSEAATEMIQPMRRAAENGAESLNATVRLRFRPDARSRKNLVPQVTIEKFRDGWLKPQE